MKKQIYFLLAAIIALVCYTIFRNAKTHVEAVEVVEELAVVTDSLSSAADSLTETVTVLHKEKDSVISEKHMLDSVLDVKDMVITKQSSAIKSLRNDTAALKKVSTIVIRDTVYVTESKNFWGKTKKSVETSTDVDTLLEESDQDTLQ